MPSDLAAFESSLAARGISAGRQRDHLRLLRDFGRHFGGVHPSEVEAPDLRAFFEARHAAGYAPNTLRKERQMVLSFFDWAVQENVLDPARFEALRRVKPPGGGSSRIQPTPYSAKELRRLWKTMEDRWPKLPDAEARKRVERWQRGVAPYRRIRSHVIRTQLEAVVALSLHSALRRGETFELHVDDMHPDNAHVVVWSGERFKGDVRLVPFTEACRARVSDWIDLRARLSPAHDRPWLNVRASATVREPVARDTFDKLLSNYIGTGWTYRRLRHTGGVNWLRAGMSLWELQRFLGHRSLKDTMPYGEAIEVPLDPLVERLDARLTRRLPLPA